MPWDEVYSAPDPLSSLTSDKIVEPHLTPLLRDLPSASDAASLAGDSPDPARVHKTYPVVPLADDSEDLDVRAMQVILSLLLPWLHTSTSPVHLALVSGAHMADKLLQSLLAAHGTDPTTLRTVQDRPMSIRTSPLLPAAFHQVYLDMAEMSGHERLQVRVCTLCESGHLQPTPLQLPRGIGSSPHLPESAESMLPSISRFSPHTPDAPDPSSLPVPAVTVKADGARSLMSGSSPLRIRPMENVFGLSHLHGHREPQPRPLSTSQSSKHLQAYDMSTMLRSIEKWDPVMEWSDVSDGPDMAASPLLSRPTEASGPPLSSRASSRSIQTPSLSLRTDVASVAPSLVPLSLRANVASTPPSSSFPRTDTPSTLSNVSAFAQSILGHFPSSASLVNSSHAPPSPGAPQPQSLWQSICVRLLPLFYDQAGDLRIESVSDSMETYVRFQFERDPDQAPAVLEDQLQKLLSTGLVGVTMQMQQSEGTQRVRELVRVWQHYYDTVIPFVHASMLPLETMLYSCHVLAAVSSHQENRSVSRAPMHEHPRPPLDAPPTHPVPPALDVRRVLLLAFRDLVVLPVCDWLHSMTIRLESEPLDATTSLRPRLTQMIHILACLYTEDEAQVRIERLCRALDPTTRASSRMSIHGGTPSMLGQSAQPSPTSPLPHHAASLQLDSPTLGMSM
ncbi:hypothetical protein MCAP1_001581 [Malassezia caprae]|uniref:Uncharacterized protein n=1 Tax=Malassezia caprae TaxID=1381934 RepID=A0AAF0E9U2_9BASI|nr:hypothetical protein MCAP1_001581 [Malassezia caprae]